MISLKELTLDGTEIEANANRYTFAWGKAIKVSREQTARQLKEMWPCVEDVYQDEKQQPIQLSIEEKDPQAVEQRTPTGLM